MKRIALKRQLLLLLTMVAILYGRAQNKTLVYGNLGVENVNISVLNTQNGTVSDAKGHYKLLLTEKNKRINLHYSCIGYQDTVVSLLQKQLEKDSINISFKMQKQKYALEEVSVLAERPRFEGGRNIIVDFEMYDGTVCMLQGNGNNYRLLLADEELAVFDTLPIRKDIKPVLLLKDCLGNCQLVAADSVYEIHYKDKPYTYIPVERRHYFSTMGDCQFMTDKHLYFRVGWMGGLATSFYRIDIETKQLEPLFVDDGSDKLVDIADEMRFAALHPPENGRGPTLSLWHEFVRGAWFCKSAAYLALADDKLVYFDHNVGLIRQSDLDLNELSACVIDYQNENDWKPYILQDLKTNKFYTFISCWLHEIDLSTGQTIPKTRLDVDLFNKVTVYGGHLYIMKRGQTSTGDIKSFVERIDLD
ncbi:MAG: carboxypeptidase-like regulatory domain-containing protein [Bacteroidales bacterium]|nr:carboxypeptidase-like regulatory domain-containing protein [Bacteroidales bacterium]